MELYRLHFLRVYEKDGNILQAFAFEPHFSHAGSECSHRRAPSR